jgi:hypothetical protein
LPGSTSGASAVTGWFRQHADAELHADDGGLTGRDVDAGLLELLEALELGLDLVPAEREQRRAIEAALVGDDDAGVAGVEVGDGDGDARKNGARLIGDDAFNRPVDGGRLGGRGQRGGE